MRADILRGLALYGPNIDLQSRGTPGEGQIAGEECLAYADDGTGRKNVTMMCGSRRASIRAADRAAARGG